MKMILVLGVFFSQAAFSWGPTGHRAIGEVAQKHLTLKSKSAVNKILGGQSLAGAANWPDEIKSEPQTYSHTYDWHYTDWPEEMHQHDETNSSGKLMTAINEQLATLKDPSADSEKKKFALRFVIHLIGDLHMPLHVGNGLDRGGNSCRVTFHGKSTNLHALWDEGLIDFTKLSFTELARFSMENKNKTDRRTAMSGTPLDWAQESKTLRAQIYPPNVKENPKAMTSMREYCRTDISVTPEMMPKLSYEYSYEFMPLVQERIYQAGVRLAMLLNQTF